ncbi:hypothetical protein L484_004623 [Morus notabilis]|uniref:Uncharacterized protein n=1 Tax=Morus notabilis TaxID=981085 RepID=W9SJD9_9ROSA|nr:hypothetical protein L484_004623 [Morus notabilis]
MVEISWSSSSSDGNSILSEIEAYMGGPSEGFGDEFDNVDRMLDEEVNKIPFTGDSISGVAASTVDAPLAATSGDPDRLFFTTDVVASRVRNRDIIRAVKEGYINVSHDRPKLSGNRLARVETTFLYSEKARHIDTLLTEFKLRGARLILDLPDLSDPLAVREYFHLSDEGKLLDLARRFF